MKSDERRKSASTTRARRGLQSFGRHKNTCNDQITARVATMKRSTERRKSASTARARRGLQSLGHRKHMCNDQCATITQIATNAEECERRARARRWLQDKSPSAARAMSFQQRKLSFPKTRPIRGGGSWVCEAENARTWPD